MELEKEIEIRLRSGGYTKAHESKAGTKNEGKVSAGYRLSREDGRCRLSFDKGNMVFFGMPPERVYESLMEMVHHLQSISPEWSYTFENSREVASVYICKKNEPNFGSFQSD